MTRLHTANTFAQRTRRTGNDNLAAFGVLCASAAFLLALFGSLDHPASWIGLRQFPFRYAPTALSLLAIVCFFVSGRLTRAFRSWPVLFALLLVAYHLGGALTYVFAFRLGGVDESYLGRGLNMLGIFAGAAVGSHPRLLKAMGKITLLPAMLISLLGLFLLTGHSLGIFFPALPQLIRTPMILLAPGLALLCNRYPWLVLRVGIVGLLVINGYLSGKSTHYLLALGILALSYGGDFMSRLAAIGSRLSSRGKAALAILVAPFALALLGAFSWVFAVVVEERATRYEYDARLRGVEYRLEQIADNPILGEFFIATTNVSDVMKFGTNVPSHNDWLDMIAAGGFFAFALFLGFLLPALFGAAMKQSLSVKRRQVHFLQYAWYMIFFYVLGASGNPMLSDPYLSVPAWTAIGISLGFNAVSKAVNSRPRSL